MKKLVLGLIIFVGIIFIVGCGNKEMENELDKILKENNYIVVDVRTEEEYNTGHVVNSLNIPYDEIDEDTDLDKTKTILVYCKSGVRSNKAYNTLKSLGYNAYDLGAYDSVKLNKE